LDGVTGDASPEPLLGDVVISVETARRQAADYDVPLQREIYRLLIHGLLHLVGHDHVVAAERRVMRREERRLAQAIGLPWPYATDADASPG
ncbi:MAG: rRNA maturation RNase YbeY, partial [Candidatus Eremiobacteraeota bacterium]|nr:rRNA maturation RNase YbeY [Candidatus Eremiobacteraeota bacterium]